MAMEVFDSLTAKEFVVGRKDNPGNNRASGSLLVSGNNLFIQGDGTFRELDTMPIKVVDSPSTAFQQSGSFYISGGQVYVFASGASFWKVNIS